MNIPLALNNIEILKGFKGNKGKNTTFCQEAEEFSLLPRSP